MGSGNSFLRENIEMKLYLVQKEKGKNTFGFRLSLLSQARFFSAFTFVSSFKKQGKILDIFSSFHGEMKLEKDHRRILRAFPASFEKIMQCTSAAAKKNPQKSRHFDDGNTEVVLNYASRGKSMAIFHVHQCAGIYATTTQKKNLAVCTENLKIEAHLWDPPNKPNSLYWGKNILCIYGKALPPPSQSLKKA